MQWHLSLGRVEKTVELFLADTPGKPIIYIPTNGGEEIMRILGEEDCFSLAAVSGMDWNRELSPWEAPAVFKGDEAFSGGAGDFLAQLVGEIVPLCEGKMQSAPVWRGIAGYSLAGLFALYSMYETEYFSRFASVSGSLWFPGFSDFAKNSEPKARAEKIYLSLGDRESRTRNRLMRPVGEITEELAAFYREKGIKTKYELNPGNHFTEEDRRVAAGIRWLLSD